MRLRADSNGFTILELMIATTVFSVMLLICATGLIQIGRMYQKGVVENQTQEVARSVMVSIAESIQFSGGKIAPSIANGGTSPNLSNGFCIDNKRYSYLKDYKLVDSASPAAGETNRAFMVDTSGGSCSSSMVAQDLKNTGTGTELLAPNMRVLDLSVSALGEDLYTVTVNIGYGDKDLFVGGNCIANRIGGSFCASSNLTTTVQKRIIR